MIKRVIGQLRKSGVQEIRVVVGYGETLVRQVVEPLGAICFPQNEQRGTAHAVQCAHPETLHGFVIIVNGDHPFLQSEDLSDLRTQFEGLKDPLAVVSATLKKPGSYGRIIRSGGTLKAIVEAHEATPETLKIQEINTGIYLAQAEVLTRLLPKIEDHNRKGEYYLTDLVEVAQSEHVGMSAILGPKRLAMGVNTQRELALASKILFRKKCYELMEQGVVVIDPAHTYIEESVMVGPSSVIYPGTYLRGETTMGPFCVVEPHCHISNAKVGESVQIRAGSYIEDASIDSRCVIGPYARLRPGTVLAEEVQIGNFVECKNAQIGKKSKASHLTYLGDVDIGSETNIGCGTITCNYQANRKKYRTKIGSNVFVGSDTQFIAPVEVGDGSIIASGSTITSNVPDHALALSRGRQVIKEGYARKYRTLSEKEPSSS